MTDFVVVDAMHSRGKTRAALLLMEARSVTDSYLYVTDSPATAIPVCSFAYNLEQLKQQMREGRTVAVGKELLTQLDTEALHLIVAHSYTLILDTELDVIRVLDLGMADVRLILREYAKVDSNTGLLRWQGPADVDARFQPVRVAAQIETVFVQGLRLIQIQTPSLFLRFRRVYILTYLFEGSYMAAYMKFCNFSYRTVGLTGGEFSDRPDEPPPFDYSALIQLVSVEDRRRGVFIRSPGRDCNALTEQWYSQRSSTSWSVRQVFNNLRTFFERRATEPASGRLWTAPECGLRKIIGDTYRYMGGYLPMTVRYTESFKNATAVAYLGNPYPDPAYVRFFNDRGIEIDPDLYALAELLRFIWFSAVQMGVPIRLFVCSKRMLDILTNWMEDMKGGGCHVP